MDSSKVDAGSRASSTRVEQTRRERPQETREPTEVQRERRPEVQISDRARELGSSARSESTQAVEPPRPTAPPQAPPAEVEFKANAVLAVRSGPAPVENLNKNPDAAVREALEERAGLRRVGEVLERPEERAESVAMTLPGEGTAVPRPASAPVVELMGAGGAAARESVAFTPVGSGGGGDPATQPDPVREQQRQRQAEGQEVARGDDRDHLDRATVIASQSGAVRNADVDRGQGPDAVDLPGEAKRPAGEKIADSTLTKAGVVEAKAEEEIVSRYVTNTPAQDAGPEPSPSHHLGTRAQPLSTYA